MFGNIDLLQILLSIPAILIAFTFHEFAHAIVADRLGDRTPRFQGRITLNPMAHIDILGFIMFLVARFGWAKPVQTNPSAYKNYYKDDMKVSFAGPLANLIIAVIFMPIFLIYSKFFSYQIISSSVLSVISEILINIVYYNVILFVLNLIPIPGFDGYHILSDIFPSTFNKLNYKIGNFQIVIMILFIATPISSYLVGVPSNWIFKTLYKVFGSIIYI